MPYKMWSWSLVPRGKERANLTTATGRTDKQYDLPQNVDD